MYTVCMLILWFINKCVITFLAISQCRVVKKVGGGKAPLAPLGSDAYGVNFKLCGHFSLLNHHIYRPLGRE